MIELIISRLKNSAFLKNVALLASGSAIAQLIAIVSSPIITRLYTPEDFAKFAIFTAIVGSISQVVCGKYEIAILVPKSNTTAMHLFGVATYFSLAVSVFVFFTLVIWSKPLVSLLGAENLGVWLFITPVALLLNGLLSSSTFFANRSGNYKLIMHTTVFRSISVLLLTVIIGLLGGDGSGLILGNLIGLIAAVAFIGFCQKNYFQWDFFSGFSEKLSVARQFSDYPLYNASTGLLNGVLVSMPILFINHYYSEQVVGYFALVVKVMTLPTAFISSSVSQVNLKKVVDLSNTGKSVTKYLYKISFFLFCGASLPAIVLIVWAPEIFSVVFGTSWFSAGRYLQILMPAIVIRFVASTLSTTLGATQNNRLGAIWKIIAFFMTACVFLYYAPQHNIYKLLFAILVNDIFIYGLYLFFILFAAKRVDRSNFLAG